MINIRSIIWNIAFFSSFKNLSTLNRNRGRKRPHSLKQNLLVRRLYALKKASGAEYVVSLFIRGSKPRRAESTATPSNPITDETTNFTVGLPSSSPLCRPDYTLYLPSGHVNLRLPPRDAFLPWSRRSLKARIEHSCVRPNAPESGCTQYAIEREHEDASNVRDGHLCNGGNTLVYTLSMSTFANRLGISNSIYILNAKATKKKKKSSNWKRRFRMRPNLTERWNRQK